MIKRKNIESYKNKKIWYKDKLFLVLTFIILNFLLDYVSYHFKNELILLLISISSMLILHFIFISYVLKLIENIPLWIYAISFLLYTFLIIIVWSLCIQVFESYREYQLKHNRVLTTGKINDLYYKNSKTRDTYYIEFEFNIGDKKIKDKKILDKEEWKKFIGKDSVSLFFVPNLPLNNALLFP